VGTPKLTLTLMRHGEAQPIDSCPEDFERALTKRGTAQAKEMGARIARRRLIPDLILASPAERAWTTASLVAAACELDAKQIQCARELYLAEPETIWRLVTGAHADLTHVLVCGHNPGLSRIASHLGPKLHLRDLSTAGLATAVWQGPVASWASLQPETAHSCEFDDPEHISDWT
jgi:phosphohistidine phosphatase